MNPFSKRRVVKILWALALASIGAVLSIGVEFYIRSEDRPLPQLDFETRLGIADSGASKGLFVKNNGTAPARVKQMRIAIDGKSEDGRTTKDAWASASIKVGLPDRTVSYGGFESGDSLLNGDEKALLVALPQDLEKNSLDKRLREALGRIAVEICYCTSAWDHCRYVNTGNVGQEPLPCFDD